MSYQQTTCPACGRLVEVDIRRTGIDRRRQRIEPGEFVGVHTERGVLCAGAGLRIYTDAT